MNKRTQKYLALALTGGVLLQAAGCSQVFGQSIAQILFSTLLQQLVSSVFLAL